MQKDILLALVLSAPGLVSCASPRAPAPALTITGTWDGRLSYQGTDFAILTGPMIQTDSPTPGDYEANLAASTGGVFILLGNVSTGILKTAGDDGDGTFTCKGAFTNAAEYTGTCFFSFQGSSFDLNIALKKR